MAEIEITIKTKKKKITLTLNEWKELLEVARSMFPVGYVPYYPFIGDTWTYTSGTGSVEITTTYNS